MHDIEPYYNWQSKYLSEEDENSPFYGKVYNQFGYDHQIYNYYIHPQWDEFGSETLYGKIIFADYEKSFAILEMIGEWNDCLGNDVMFLKRNIADHLIDKGITKFIVICENVLNFHASDEAYYEEWYEDVIENRGWICFINTNAHVQQEMQSATIHHYAHLGDGYNDVNWRKFEPANFVNFVEASINGGIKQMTY